MKEMGRVILESLIVTLVGVGIGLYANTKTGRGLTLSRDYFKLLNSTPAATAPAPNGVGPASSPAVTASPAEQLIRSKGFTPVQYGDVLRLYQDHKYQIDAFVFLDAREDEPYRAGHIPRAWRHDHARPEQTLPMVLPMVQSAEKVIVYCNGGNCDDSLLVAGDLRDQHGIDPGRLLVYAGGLTEWSEKGQPVEKGERGSGDITTGGGK